MSEIFIALADLIIIGAMLFVVGVAVIVAYGSVMNVLMKWRA